MLEKFFSHRTEGKIAFKGKIIFQHVGPTFQHSYIPTYRTNMLDREFAPIGAVLGKFLESRI